MMFKYAHGQTNVTIEQCITWSLEANPLGSNKAEYEQIAELRTKNANAVYYPMLRLEGQLNHQSDVFDLPISIPNMPALAMPEVPHTQYNLSLNLYQTIYNGSNSLHSKKAIQTERDIMNLKLDVGNRTIAEKVSEIYFYALILQENIKIYETIIADLNERKNVISSLVEQGALTVDNLNSLEIEILGLRKKLAESNSNRSQVMQTLENLTQIEGFSSYKLIKPNIESKSTNVGELDENRVFQSQLKLNNINTRVIYSNLLPTVSLMARYGYGNPNPFNFFDEGTFYQVGLKFSWTVWDWSANKRQRSTLQVQNNIIRNEEENFNLQRQNVLIKEQENIRQYSDNIEIDKQLIGLRKSNMEISFAKLQNGIITGSEFSREVANLANSEISYNINQILLTAAIHNYNIKSGNYQIKE